MATKHCNYKPRYPQKYTGKYPISLKSSWEEEFARRDCDLNESCLKWEYEPVAIHYQDPLGGGTKPYYPDFLVTFLTPNKAVKTVLVEIKPLHEALPEHARSRADAMVQLRNMAKWKAAIAWCLRRGYEFRRITEAELFLGGDKIKPRKRPIRPFGQMRRRRR